MNKLKYILLIACFTVLTNSVSSQGVLIPTDSSQADFLKAYKLVLEKSDKDYHLTGTVDSILFPKYGEFSVYWAGTGADKGNFVLPESVPLPYSSVTATNYFSPYNWAGSNHYSLQFKRSQKPIALFKSSILRNNLTITWASLYFKNAFDTYLYDDMYYFVNEQTFDNNFLSDDTRLLIFPSFVIEGNNSILWMDSVLTVSPHMKAKIDTFLSKGGTIYAEGNAVYLIEKLGFLDPGAVDFNHFAWANPNTNLIDIDITSAANPISFTTDATGNHLFAASVPTVNTGSAEVVARLSSNSAPAVFVLKDAQAGGGRIICNLGMPTIGGCSDVLGGSRQLQWTFNTLLYSFSNSVDVTRSVFNDLPNGIVAGKNAIPYDKADTFEVRVKVRNLSSVPVANAKVKEKISDYFSFVDVGTLPSGISYTISGNDLEFSCANLPAASENTIVYRLQTPPLTSQIHEDIDNYIAWDNYINTSLNSTEYADNEGKHGYNKFKAYADVMFSADLAADADLNWKNFLGIYYQPFKVFMIMENKERTAAQQTQYVQYIPKDVPFYWVDHSLNVPVLKTPGGKFVDVLKGSNDQGIPQFDISNNGHPDAWLDTASIYPKGYILTEDSVYWQNPWHRLATGDTVPYYEDIDHDGLRAQDQNNDGIAEIGEPGDKIRVWKVTWNINDVPGHQVYDPYCSYEIWVDPPDLVKMAAGIGHVNGTLTDSVPGMFYPYSPDLNSPNLADTSWTHWMDRDSTGQIKWVQLIYQSINNYEGYTFIDTAAIHYQLLPTDSCAGTVPQPHNEFIAVLSMGGEEIDMNNPTPACSNYSNIDYKTIFNENKKTPIRTTYTYYAPLPNPLQFEYLTNNYIIKDSLNNTLQTLPSSGKAYISYNVDASTEYSYYWIRNVGHDVDFNDPSLASEGAEGLGDGVFGYMVYDIPKGFSNYKITLPTLAGGGYDINSIVQVDGHPFQQWLINPNTSDSISIWEDDFCYHIHMPQLLIPPALCDKNGDGTDDWIDDRGDRFHSPTGYLHDVFMLGDGETYPAGATHVFSHLDEGMAGQVDSGWCAGADNTYGSDWFDNPGRVRFSINAIYEGKGKEGPVEISKGGWLVVEEIFGGSPWVIFSHTLSAFAQGVDLSVISTPSPVIVRKGIDTCYVKHKIEDLNEPHEFDGNFDPYHVCYGYGDVSISTYAGGKDPCSLITPSNAMSAIVDPLYDHETVTLVPLADAGNPDLAGFPQTVSGTFVEAMVTVVNGTEDNWVDTKISPVIPSELGNTHVVMKYVAYPRPLVPAVADPNTGAVLHSGDQIGSFSAGWRFNQPDGEVLVKMGDTLNLLQPTRRAYFMFLISIDETLPQGVYSIPFNISGTRVHYTGTNNGAVSYDVPRLQFSVTPKTSSGNIIDFEKLVIGESDLSNLTVNTTPEFKGLENVKWSVNDVNHTDFPSMTDTLSASYSPGQEVISVNSANSLFNSFPSADTSLIYILEQGEVDATNAQLGEDLDITTSEILNYTYSSAPDSVGDHVVSVIPLYPLLFIDKKIYSINGTKVGDNDTVSFMPDTTLEVVALVSCYNFGSDMAVNTIMNLTNGPAFEVMADSLPLHCSSSNPVVTDSMGAIIPGQKRALFIHYHIIENICDSIYDVNNLISKIDLFFSGNLIQKNYTFADSSLLKFPASELNLFNLAADKTEALAGDGINISVNAENKGATVKNAWLRVYSILGGDTLLIGENHYDKINSGEVVNYSLSYTVPGDAYTLFLFSKIESLDTFEVCTNNNRKTIRIKILEGAWIDNVFSSPNPFTQEVGFYYELGSDMKEINIDLFTSEGKDVDHISKCPSDIGFHVVKWNGAALNQGVYYFRISGTDAKGKTHEYTDKIVKN